MSAIVLGTAASGAPAVVEFFAAERGTAAAVIGDPALPDLIALRALGVGARVQVITSEPRRWMRLREACGLPAGRMLVVAPGTPPPPDGTPVAPWMIINDGQHETSASGPWQAVVAVPSARAVTVPALRGLDMVFLHRSSPACRAAVIAAMNLPVPAALSLNGIPRDVVVIASAGSVRFVPLTPDATERALLRHTQNSELAWPLRRSNEYRFGSGLTRTLVFETENTGPEGEVA